ncbi:hypothetical protein BaRGS_00006936 [Batillaria attramentaria]|uniref:Uncharacterized protein n=1 Tax=Batillaria attramentaria TaxID=370345 RepID=A0ABD0LQR4_9CAEN
MHSSATSQIIPARRHSLKKLAKATNSNAFSKLTSSKHLVRCTKSLTETGGQIFQRFQKATQFQAPRRDIMILVYESDVAEVVGKVFTHQ